jgi:cysteinyl-tRNA synthetase
MSLRLLGDGFDLHGGGDDLVFPHHENERAQAEGAGHDFARYWIHNGMVMVGTEKMAKSLGNFTTLADALDVHGPRAIRLAVLQTHYRKQMELGDKELTDGATAIQGLDNLARRARVAGIDPSAADLDDAALGSFRAHMDEDFGTPGAVAVIFDTARWANTAIDRDDRGEAATLLATVIELAGALGLELDAGAEIDRDDEIGGLIERRNSAREHGDYAEADRIRAELADRGITLEDTPSGTIWHR